jgi:hypothetical protein
MMQNYDPHRPVAMRWECAAAGTWGALGRVVRLSRPPVISSAIQLIQRSVHGGR